MRRLVTRASTLSINLHRDHWRASKNHDFAWRGGTGSPASSGCGQARRLWHAWRRRKGVRKKPVRHWNPAARCLQCVAKSTPEGAILSDFRDADGGFAKPRRACAVTTLFRSVAGKSPAPGRTGSPARSRHGPPRTAPHGGCTVSAVADDPATLPELQPLERERRYYYRYGLTLRDKYMLLCVMYFVSP